MGWPSVAAGPGAAGAAKADDDASARAGGGLAKLDPISLADYPLAPGDTSSTRARQTRQADAVALLRAGRIGDLAGLLEYDVEATPELSAVYRTAIAPNGQLDLTAKREPGMAERQGCDLAGAAARAQIPIVPPIIGTMCRRYRSSSPCRPASRREGQRRGVRLRRVQRNPLLSGERRKRQ